MGIIYSNIQSIIPRKYWGHLLLSAAAFLLALNGTQANPKEPVKNLQISRGYGLAAQYFDLIVDFENLRVGVGTFLKRTNSSCVEYAMSKGKSAQSIAAMSGRWLEYSVLIALRENSIAPVYWQSDLPRHPIISMTSWYIRKNVARSY